MKYPNIHNISNVNETVILHLRKVWMKTLEENTGILAPYKDPPLFPYEHKKN